MNVIHSYKTIAHSTESIIFKERKSKFYGYAFPILYEQEVEPLLQLIKESHTAANHVCYAWQIGVQNVSYRANDDGEPNNSAGLPIYGQIQSFEVTNILVAIARIFGGIKLGVGGLIGAYKNTAHLALTNSKIIVKETKQLYRLKFNYPVMNAVMRFIKRNQLQITNQELHLNCTLEIAVPLKIATMVTSELAALQNVTTIYLDKTVDG